MISRYVKLEKRQWVNSHTIKANFSIGMEKKEEKKNDWTLPIIYTNHMAFASHKNLIRYSFRFKRKIEKKTIRLPLDRTSGIDRAPILMRIRKKTINRTNIK